MKMISFACALAQSDVTREKAAFVVSSNIVKSQVIAARDGCGWREAAAGTEPHALCAHVLT